MKYATMAVLAAALLMSCSSNDNGRKEGTRQVASDIRHWARDLSACLELDPTSEFCRGIEGLNETCLGVAIENVTPRFGDAVTEADWDSLSELCDQVDVLMSSPRMFAQRELQVLDQRASAVMRENQ